MSENPNIQPGDRSMVMQELAAAFGAVSVAGGEAELTDTPVVELPDDVVARADEVYQQLKPDTE